MSNQSILLDTARLHNQHPEHKLEALEAMARLTTEPNDVVGRVHPKAMPVILTKEEEIETWLTAPADEAVRLQRSLNDGVLKVVATGELKDGET